MRLRFVGAALTLFRLTVNWSKRASAAVAALLILSGCSSSSDDALFRRPELEELTALDDAASLLALTPNLVTDIHGNAAAAAYGYVLALGLPSGDGWQADLRAAPWASDRLALGLIESGVVFERVGESGSIFHGPSNFGDLTSLLGERVITEPDQMAAFGAVVEVGGNVSGRVARLAPTNVDRVVSLSQSVGIELDTFGSDSVELWVDGVNGQTMLAALPVVCEVNLPLVGGAGCSRVETTSVSLTADGAANELWLTATTGPLGPEPALEPASAAGGVSWNNNEAQDYRPANVEVGDGFVLRAEPHPDPDVLVLPYTSGMVVSTHAYGFGLLAFDVVVPAGEGLWPALWLLDAEACESPGRCAGYLTPAYHEIDLLETRGSDPDNVFASVHWWDGRIQSNTVARQVEGLSSGVHTIELDRRPGLLVWSVDGVEVHRVAGLTAGDGAHRTAPMRIIANLAVGGSFAGDHLVGRNGEWWGDAKVPAFFPNVGWSTAELVISDIRFTALI